MSLPGTIPGMPRKEAKKRLAKEMQTIYISADIRHAVEKAAHDEGMSISIYIEQTLRARLKKEKRI